MHKLVGIISLSALLIACGGESTLDSDDIEVPVDLFPRTFTRMWENTYNDDGDITHYLDIEDDGSLNIYQLNTDDTGECFIKGNFGTWELASGVEYQFTTAGNNEQYTYRMHSYNRDESLYMSATDGTTSYKLGHTDLAAEDLRQCASSTDASSEDTTLNSIAKLWKDGYFDNQASEKNYMYISLEGEIKYYTYSEPNQCYSANMTAKLEDQTNSDYLWTSHDENGSQRSFNIQFLSENGDLKFNGTDGLGSFTLTSTSKIVTDLAVCDVLPNELVGVWEDFYTDENGNTDEGYTLLYKDGVTVYVDYQGDGYENVSVDCYEFFSASTITSLGNNNYYIYDATEEEESSFNIITNGDNTLNLTEIGGEGREFSLDRSSSLDLSDINQCTAEQLDEINNVQ